LSAHYFKLAADQGNVVSQVNYGLCLQNGAAAVIDSELAVHYFKLAADQGYHEGQVKYGVCLENGRGVVRDVKLAVVEYKRSADQNNAEGQCRYAACLEQGKGIEIDLNKAIAYYKLSADQGNAEAQYKFAVHCLSQDRAAQRTGLWYLSLSAAGGYSLGQLHFGYFLENGIGIEADHILSAKYYELSSECLAMACAFYGWCLQHGRGVPVDLRTAAEYYQKASDGGNVDGANSLGVCFDVGLGVEKDIERSVFYYRKAALQHHPAGMNNYGRCLEYGQTIERDLDRAAKYYRMSAHFQNADGANNFGICLERGIGVKMNQDLAASYYRQSADAGHSDGSNNFGFCLEHGRGVKQNIVMAAEYYKRAADCGHVEAEYNYQRCLRLLGFWSASDRSSAVSEQKPRFEETDVVDGDELIESHKEFAATKQMVKSIHGWDIKGELGQSKFSVVKLVEDQERNVKRVMKTLQDEKSKRYFEREYSIHKQLNHPLIVGFESYIEAGKSEHPMIVEEFVPNGSLAEHLPWSVHSEGNVVSGETRIAKIVTGIVLGMRYLHWRGIIKYDLKPENIFVDFDWIVRLGNFGHSVIVGETSQEDINDSDHFFDAGYTAPESFENSPTLESDVFSFGVILSELLSKQPGFSRDLSHHELMKQIVLDEIRPRIPDSICADVSQLIQECFEQNPARRPTFVEILSRLDKMDFRITPGVKSETVRRFVTIVKSCEKELGIEIEDID
jgi:TPR repeat protein